MTTLATTLARNEADLISAAAAGSQAFHAVLFQKLAELDLDVDDRQAVMDMLTDEREKTAAQGGGFGIGHALALGSILAPMAAAGAKWLANRSSHDEGWQNLQMTAPDVIAQDPARARSIYDLIHSTAPNIATNPVVAADLMRQMTSMPMVDLGSVKTLSETGRNMGQVGQFQHQADNAMYDPLDKYKVRSEAFNMLTGGKTASLRLPVRHVAQDGTPCVFDWSTPAMKEAGITDAFTSGFSGNGTTMDQANSATQMEQLAGGQSLLPLDAVVRELIAKEMELSQREQMLQQQEMQMQQAMQMQGQMGQIYQQQYGVDPSTGQPAQDPAAAGAQDPAAGAPSADPTAGAPPADPAAAPGQDPAAAPGQDPAAAGGDPAAAGATAQPDPTEVAQDAGQGAPMPQDPNAGAPPAAGDPAAQASAAGDPNAAAGDPNAAAGDPNAAPVEGADPNAATAAAGQDPNAVAAGEDPNAGMVPPEGEDPAAAGQDPNAAAAAMPQQGGAPQMPPMAAGGQMMTAMPDGLHIEIPLPSLHLHIKTAEVPAAPDPLEAEKQAAIATFNDLFSDIFRP